MNSSEVANWLRCNWNTYTAAILGATSFETRLWGSREAIHLV